MLEGLHHEVQRIAAARQRRGAVLAGGYQHGIEQHRGHGREGGVDRDLPLRCAGHAAKPGRDDLALRTCCFERLLNRFERSRVDAVGRQNRDLARAHRPIAASLHAERARLFEARRHLVIPKAGAAGRGFGVGLADAEHFGDAARQFFVDMREVVDHALADRGHFELGQLETKRRHDMLFFGRALAVEEQARLREVVVEGLAAAPQLWRVQCLGERLEAPTGTIDAELAAVAQRIRLVGDLATRDAVPVHAVALEVVHRAHRAVDRQFVKVGATEARDLRVDVREQAALQQRVVAEVDARHHVAGMERDLFGFGKKVIRVTVQRELADFLHRHQFFGDQLGRVKQVEAKGVLLVLRNHLHAKLPFGEVAVLDRLPQIAAMKVRILAGNLLRFVPCQAVHAELGFPVKLDKVGLAARIHKSESVHAEAFHHAQAARDGAVAHDPHQHVGGLGHQRGKVPKTVVRAGRLWHLVVRLGLDGVHQVGELDRILDEEHRNVVADQVVVAFPGVELDGKTAHVAHCIGRTARAGHIRKAHEDRRAQRRVLQKVGAGELRHRLVELEIPVRGRATGVHHALGNALVVEVRDLLAQDEVFEQRRAARAGFERIVVVRDRHALVGRELRLRLDRDGRELLLLDGSTLAIGRVAIACFRAPTGGRFVLWRHAGFLEKSQTAAAREPPATKSAASTGVGFAQHVDDIEQ